MPEITIYTNDGDCANGVAEINPFTVGDATDEWTLKFNNGTDFYSPSNVTMRVGHTNGLPDGTYNNAFKWVDRADNKSTGSISVSSGVPTLSFNTNPSGGVVGTNGVYILRGPDLDGAITSIEFLSNGLGETQSSGWPSNNRFGLMIDGGNLYPSRGEVTTPDGSGTSYAMGYADFNSTTGVGQTSIVVNGGLGFPVEPVVGLATSPPSAYGFFNGTGYFPPTFRAIGNWAKYEFPFKRDESGNNIIAATTLSPYSDGEVTGTTQYDHSTLVIRPETVATASLTSSGLNWVGTMNPINAYTTSRLSLRNSTQLDLQIRGDGRTLFQGQLTILNKIA
jgi:hypothetical protein